MTRYNELKKLRSQYWIDHPLLCSCDPYSKEIEAIEVAALKTVDTTVLKRMWDEWDCVSMFPVGRIHCNEWQVVDELRLRGVEIII